MKKQGQQNKAWYHLTSAQDAAGKWIRFYVIYCRRCGAQGRYHAAHMAEDGLRKLFTRLKWDIGSGAKHHLCPTCAGRVQRPVPRPAPEPAKPAPAPAPEVQHYPPLQPIGVDAQLARLIDAWVEAADSIKASFIHLLFDSAHTRSETIKRLLLERALELAFAWAPPPEPASKLEPEPPEPEPEPAEPAAWFQELMER